MSLPSKLVGKSSMTRRQLDSLEAYLNVRSGMMNMREAADSAPGGAVTVGSYYRTMSQARRNIRQSMVTMLIGVWLGAIRLEDVKRMFELVGSGARDIADSDQDRLVQVLEALVDRILV